MNESSVERIQVDRYYCLLFLELYEVNTDRNSFEKYLSLSNVRIGKRFVY